MSGHKRKKFLKTLFTIDDFDPHSMHAESEKIDNDLVSSDDLFLKRFTHDEMNQILTKVGLFTHLKNIGFRNVEIDIYCDPDSIHYLRVYDIINYNRNIIIDLRLSDKRYRS